MTENPENGKLIGVTKRKRRKRQLLYLRFILPFWKSAPDRPIFRSKLLEGHRRGTGQHQLPVLHEGRDHLKSHPLRLAVSLEQDRPVLPGQEALLQGGAVQADLSAQRHNRLHEGDVRLLHENRSEDTLDIGVRPLRSSREFKPHQGVARVGHDAGQRERADSAAQSAVVPEVLLRPGVALPRPTRVVIATTILFFDDVEDVLN